MAHRPVGSRERGFTLIELVIACVIIGMLVAMGIYMRGSVLSSGRHTRAIAAASVYSAAAERFKTDSRGLYPPQAWRPSGGYEKGPYSVLARGNGNYMRTVPQIVQSGQMTVCSSPSTTAPTCPVWGTSDGGMAYTVSADRRSYRIVVFDHMLSHAPICEILSGTSGGSGGLDLASVPDCTG